MSWVRRQKKISDADCDKTSLVWAPDSKSLLWSGSDHKLRKVEIENGKTDVVASGEAGNITGPQYSPDGKWISYSKQDRLLRAHVWIKNLGDGTEHMIASDLFQVSGGAKWTPDGKKLLLIAGVSVPSMASQGFRGTPSQLYAVPLTPVDKAPDDRDINTEEQAMALLNESAGAAGRGGRGPGGAAGPGAGAPPAVTVNIEWDGLERRIQKLTSMPGPVLSIVPSPDSRSYAYMSMGGQITPNAADGGAGGGPGLYVIHEDGTAMQRLNTTVPC